MPASNRLRKEKLEIQGGDLGSFAPIGWIGDEAETAVLLPVDRRIDHKRPGPHRRLIKIRLGQLGNGHVG